MAGEEGGEAAEEEEEEEGEGEGSNSIAMDLRTTSLVRQTSRSLTMVYFTRCIEVGSFVHPCEEDLVCKGRIEKVPYFNAPIYLENKSQIGKVNEIFGPMNSYVRALLHFVNKKWLLFAAVLCQASTRHESRFIQSRSEGILELTLDNVIENTLSSSLTQ